MIIKKPGKFKKNFLVGQFLIDHADLRHVIRRAFIIEKFPYSEIQDNTISENIIPIDMLRLKLSFFGAIKFDPRSDKWLRINMFQGAPLPNELKFIDDLLLRLLLSVASLAAISANEVNRSILFNSLESK